jgi:hypothetical protein
MGELVGELTGTAAAGRKAASALEQSGQLSREQMEMSREQLEKAVADLEAVGIPSVEAQQIALQYAELGPTALEQISLDPRLAAAQSESLEQMAEFARGEISPEDRAQQMLLSGRTSREAKARDKAILQEMAQRGVAGSGAEIAARLGGSQASAQRQAEEQAQLAGQRRQAQMAAIQSRAQMAGGMEQAQYGREANLASARDRIEAFNKQQRAEALNRQEMANKALLAQRFQQEMQKQQSIAGARTGVAGSYQQQAQAEAAKGQAQASGELQTGAAGAEMLGKIGAAAIGAVPTKADGGIIPKYADGGMAYTKGYQEGGLTEGGVFDAEGDVMAGDEMPVPDSGMDEDTRYLAGDVVPGNEYAGDRVDAKVNSGEMVLNLEQQQRLMDLLRGYKDLQDLGDEDIVSPAPGTLDDLGELGRQAAPQAPEMPLEAAPMPPAGAMPPEAAMPPAGAMPPEMAMPPALKDGGMVPADFGEDMEDRYSSRRGYNSAKKPRGLHASLDHEKQELERADGDQKARKARIKALEILKNGGR